MRKTFGRTIGAAATALGLLVWAGVLQAETLADAMAAGYENSGLLDQNRALLRAADEDVAQAVSALRPIVNWSSTARLSYPGSILANISVGDSQLDLALNLQAQVTLYDGGVSRLAIDTAKELVLATRQNLLATEQDILLRVVRAFLEVQRASEFVALRENNVRLITQELRAARDRFDVGDVTRTDVSLAEARLAAAQSLLASEQGALVRAIEEYDAAVGHRPNNLVPAGPAPISQTLAEARALAVRIHPAVVEQQHNVAAAELTILRSEASIQPDLTLSGQVSLDEEFEETAALSLEFGGPIYQGGRLAAVVRQSMAQRDAQRSAMLLTARQIEQSVANSYSQLEASRAVRNASESQVASATVAFDSIREEARAGTRTTLDVLNAEQELLDARANLISAEIDEALASYTLLSAMGILTAERLNLGVQIYDPTAYYNLVDDAPAGLSEQGRALDRVLDQIGN